MAWVATFYPNWFPFEAEYCTHRDAKAWEGQWVASCRAPLQRATRCLRRGYSAELPAPGIKTHTYPPSYTHNTYSICPTNKHTSCTYTCSYLPISSFSSYMNPLHSHLQAVTWLSQAGGCQAANSGDPYMEDHPPLPNASPLQTCKLPKIARTAPKCAKTWSVCKPAKGCSSITFHMREPPPSVLIKPPPPSLPRLPIHLSRQTIPHRPSTPPEKVCHVPGQ